MVFNNIFAVPCASNCTSQFTLPPFFLGHSVFSNRRPLRNVLELNLYRALVVFREYLLQRVVVQVVSVLLVLFPPFCQLCVFQLRELLVVEAYVFIEADGRRSVKLLAYVVPVYLPFLF